MTGTPRPTHTVTARLPGGRYLVAILDPNTTEVHSPLRRHLRAERGNVKQAQPPGRDTTNPEGSPP